jgi:hypothetical protein
LTRFRLTAAVVFAGLVSAASAVADDDDSNRPFTLAVFGDWPYSQVLLDTAHLLVDSVNADNRVDLVMHVGDIHSGSMPCTSAGILPPIPASSPGWNQAVYFQFQQFRAPVVYMPGDNEWSDCHKTKQFKSGDPLKELASVRSLFFARPGHTLGLTDKDVWSQAKYYDQDFPSDAQYVENVMWKDRRVLFATFNMPGGSNNDNFDSAPWTNGFGNEAAQRNEETQRTAADIRWLETAFATAERPPRAKAVVIALQADMWDPEAIAAGGAGLDHYTSFVQRLADLAVHFGGPVLLLNGDTHLFFSDKPLANPLSTTGVIHHTQAVPNLTRIVVQGSTNKPAEWLRLTIDTRKNQPFIWTNVPYCADPSTNVCP